MKGGTLASHHALWRHVIDTDRPERKDRATLQCGQGVSTEGVETATYLDGYLPNVIEQPVYRVCGPLWGSGGGQRI